MLMRYHKDLAFLQTFCEDIMSVTCRSSSMRIQKAAVGLVDSVYFSVGAASGDLKRQSLNWLIQCFSESEQ